MKANSGQAPSTLIPEYIGSDFDAVLSCADNMTDIKTVVENLNDIEAVVDNIGVITTVAPHVEAVQDVADNLNYVHSVIDNLSTVTTVANDISNVNAVAPHIDDVDVVSNNMDKIGAVLSNIDTVATVATDIASVNTVGSHITNVDVVANNIGDVKTVASNIDDMGAVATNIEYVKGVAEGIAGLPVVSYIGTTPPPLAAVGAEWYCTTDGRTYVYYHDGDSAQWIESSPQSTIGVSDTFALWKRSLAEIGLTLVGTFQEGCTVTAVDQAVLDFNASKVYQWKGTIPDDGKVIPVNSTPATAGGVSPVAWVDRTDVTLRSDINVVVKRFASVADMVADTTLVIGQIVETIGYYAGWAAIAKPTGNNRYEIVAGGTGVTDGGSFINLANGLQAKGLFQDGVTVHHFGARGVSTDDSAYIIAANNYAVANKRKLEFPQGNYYFSANYSFTTLGHHYWEGEHATISFNGNGRMFDINCNPDRAIHVKGINFTTLNRVVNNNVTGFYLHHGTEFGSSFHFEDCDFSGMTNCSIHAIRAFKYSCINCKFYGASAYYYNSGLLTQYDDAGVRLWGADGTLTVQNHSFSNVGRFENCFFGDCKFGIDGWAIYTSRVIACTFEPCYIGIINRKVDGAIFGNISNVAKGGYSVGQIHLETCWFEQIASYYICGVDINPNDGSEAPGQSPTLFQGTGENYVTKAYRHPKTIFRSISDTVVAFRNTPDTTIDNVLLYGFANNPNVEYVKFGTQSAMVRPLLTLNNGVQLGNGTPLTVYETGTFKPTFYIGDTVQQNFPLDGIDGIYTRIGNVVHFSCKFYSTTYAKVGSGNLQLRNLPFASSNVIGLLGPCAVTSFNQVTGITNGNVFGEMIAGTPTMGLRKPDYQVMTDENLNGYNTFNLRISGYYFV